jgi:hypothetical protein
MVRLFVALHFLYVSAHILVLKGTYFAFLESSDAKGKGKTLDTYRQSGFYVYSITNLPLYFLGADNGKGTDKSAKGPINENGKGTGKDSIKACTSLLGVLDSLSKDSIL